MLAKGQRLEGYPRIVWFGVYLYLGEGRNGEINRFSYFGLVGWVRAASREEGGSGHPLG